MIDAAQTQDRWRSLHVRKECPVLEIFADYSPASWWATKVEPSVDEGKSERAFMTRRGFSSDITIAAIEANARFLLLHRRTLAWSAYEKACGSVEATPCFVLPGVDEVSRNPTYPVADWVRTIDAATEHRCRVVVERHEDVEAYRRIGVPDPLYLPPVLAPLPDRLEPRVPVADEFNVLLACEARPSHDLLSIVEAIAKGFSHRKTRLILALGEGPDSALASYREGVIEFARRLYRKRLDVRSRMERDRFLRYVSSAVDAVVVPDRVSAAGHEAKRLHKSVYWFDPTVRELKPLKLTDAERETEVRRKLDRYAFWGALK